MYTNALKLKQTPFGWPCSLLYWTKCNLFVGSHMAVERKQLGETVCVAVLGEIFGFDSLAWISHFLWRGGLGRGRRRRRSQTDTRISFGQAHSINKRTQIFFFLPGGDAKRRREQSAQTFGPKKDELLGQNTVDTWPVLPYAGTGPVAAQPRVLICCWQPQSSGLRLYHWCSTGWTCSRPSSCICITDSQWWTSGLPA